MIKTALSATLVALLAMSCVSIPEAEAKGTKCLPSVLKVRLTQVRKKFGRVRIVSTYRKNAKVAKTGKRSWHASCRAVDFNVPRKNYWKAARWLRKAHNGGVGTYSGKHNHIHIDNGRRARWHN